jgi:hypothetical protein
VSRHSHDVDVVLEDLRGELRIAPSPQFEHRVRARVMDSAGLDRPASWSPVLVLLAAVAVMSVTTTTTWVRHASSVLPSVPTITQRYSMLPARPEPGAARSYHLAPTREAIWSAASAAAAVGAASTLEFEVLVPPDQAIALRRLLAAMASGRAVVPASTTITDAETGELLEPELIGITQLPDIAPLGWREGARGRER